MFPMPLNASTKRELKVLNWNVLYGFNHHRSIKEAGEWINKQAPNVLGLQELNGISEEKLSEYAKTWGHNHTVLLKRNGFPVGLTSKKPITVIKRQVKGFHHGYLHCKTYNIHFFIVHFWPGKSHELKKILKEIEPLLKLKANVIIMGDFNTCSRKDEAFLIKNATKRKFEYDFVDMAEAKGFVDLGYKHAPNSKVTCPTAITIPRWTKTLSELKQKEYRIDFIFACKTLAKYSTKAAVYYNNQVGKLSDHYPLSATFGGLSKKCIDKN